MILIPRNTVFNLPLSKCFDKVSPELQSIFLGAFVLRDSAIGQYCLIDELIREHSSVSHRAVFYNGLIFYI